MSEMIHIRVKDNEFTEIKNDAAYYGMTVSEYIKTCCGIGGRRPFVPPYLRKGVTVTTPNGEILDETPTIVQDGTLTLEEYLDRGNELPTGATVINK